MSSLRDNISDALSECESAISIAMKFVNENPDPIDEVDDILSHLHSIKDSLDPVSDTIDEMESDSNDIKEMATNLSKLTY